MTRKQLWQETGKLLNVTQGSSCDIVATFKDANGEAITKANLATLTVTLFDKTALSVINGRNAQNVKDDNQGVVATDGTLTLRLGPLDNVIVGSVEAGKSETHVIRFTWTWTDGAVTRTGIEEHEFNVERLASPS